MQSTDLIAEQQSLNPRVRGSSPWRRTRLEFDPYGSTKIAYGGQSRRNGQGQIFVRGEVVKTVPEWQIVEP